MTTTINAYGEKVTKWKSYKHPDNPNFMQVVNWYVWEKPDNKVLVGYNLGAGGKTHFLYNLTVQEAILMYTDEYTHELH